MITKVFWEADLEYKPLDPKTREYLEPREAITASIRTKDAKLWKRTSLWFQGKEVDHDISDNKHPTSVVSLDFEKVPLELLKSGKIPLEARVERVDGEVEKVAHMLELKPRTKDKLVDRIGTLQARKGLDAARKGAYLTRAAHGWKINTTKCWFGYKFDAAKRSFRLKVTESCPPILAGGRKLENGAEVTCDSLEVGKYTFDELRKRSSVPLSVVYKGSDLAAKGAQAGTKYGRSGEETVKVTQTLTIAVPARHCVWTGLRPAKDFKSGTPILFAGDPDSKRPAKARAIVVASSAATDVKELGDVSRPSHIDLVVRDFKKLAGEKKCSYRSKTGGKASYMTRSYHRVAEVYDRRTGKLVTKKTWRGPGVPGCAKSVSAKVNKTTGDATMPGSADEVAASEKPVLDYYKSLLAKK